MALVLCSVAVAGQQPTFRTSVDLVQVDVVVVDKDGRPVEGLTAADFTILDRRKAQKIATFDEVSHRQAEETPAPAVLPGVRLDVSSNQTGQSERLIVMVVDDLHIYKERTDRAKDIARKVLADLGPQSSMAVLFTSQEHSTQVTTDRARLLAAVDTLKGRQSWRRPHQASDAQTGPPDHARGFDGNGAGEGAAEPGHQGPGFLRQPHAVQDAAGRSAHAGRGRRAAEGVRAPVGGHRQGSERLFGAMAPPGDVPQGGPRVCVGQPRGAQHDRAHRIPRDRA